MAGIKIRRPKVFTAFCVHSWIPVIINFLYAFSPTIKKMGQFYPIIFCLIDCILFISLIGVWYMKKWGVELFIVAFFAYNILFVFMDTVHFTSYTFISYTVFIIVSMIYYPKMDVNL